MSDRQAAIEAAARERREHHTHRPHWDGSGDDYCSCGAPVNGNSGWRLHVEERVLAVYLAPRRVPCPTCWGRVNDIAPGARCKNPDCSDGTVPADPYLVWADEYAPAAGEWIWVTSSDGDVQLRRVHSQEADLFVRRPKEPR